MANIKYGNHKSATSSAIPIVSVIFIFIFLSLSSCSHRNKSDDDFTDQVIELVIETSSGKIVQLPGLYKQSITTIPDDAEEKLVIVEKLKMKGFEMISWGRGNASPLGPRIVNIELRRGDCFCDVSKIYHSTADDSLYQIVEGISCKRNGEK